jgi:hypothetical protein
MTGSARMTERAGGGKRGDLLFVVHVAAPDGGFGRSLDGANPLNRHGGNVRRWPSQRLAGREFAGWCPDGLEIAKSLRHRFGGQIVPLTVQPVPRRHDGVTAAAESELEKTPEKRN